MKQVSKPGGRAVCMVFGEEAEGIHRQYGKQMSSSELLPYFQN